MKNLIYKSVVIVLASLLLVSNAHGALTIEITEGAEGALPIAIVPFGWQGDEGTAPLDVAEVIAGDLAQTGRFQVPPRENLVSEPHKGDEVNFQEWRVLGMENLVVGQLSPAGPDAYLVQFQLFDVFKGEQMAGYSIPSSARELRRTAHHVSDLLYKELTGERGAFNTRIAYVTSEEVSDGKQKYVLQVADADGYNPQTIVESAEPLMSPAWSADGRRIAYVSFEGRRPAVYAQELATGERERIASFAGINGAPAWSPDGQRLALTLSKDGNPDIYIYSLGDKSVRRLSRHYAIDTEAAWSPDGRSLVFTSDRGGKPQIYRVGLDGGRPQRLTFEGDYNARASFSPDGRLLTFVHGERGRFYIAVLELESKRLRVLSRGGLDESPSFAPNGSMIIYATAHNNQGVLAAVSVDGRVHQRLAVQEGNVREPTWSPYSEE